MIKVFFSLILLIPSLSWAKPIYLECIEREHSDSSLPKNIISFDLDTGLLTTFDNKFTYMMYKANDIEILAQEANSSNPSFISINRITGEMIFQSDTLVQIYDCELRKRKF